ncbi:hypothetical protein [Paucisalibacillus sp. EB02]|uniref:hypothetical protein n=1 Tax=Paucisalibacillus sp. EB02 TaxID=1347087 RepID=UPI0004BCE8B0|nr:hypothetical protein [Paucisalibacillus sp. EB02]
MDVWYASYGSNIMEKRFMAYIHGGIVQGSEQLERGCHDKTAPKKSGRIDIKYPLYFSKEGSKWGKGGVAFIGTEQSETENTIGRMYLITEEQFRDVVSQENNGMEVQIDLIEVEKNGFVDIHNGWYNRVVFLGKQNGSPIFTFTSSYSLNSVLFTKPSSAYLSVIAKGLMELGLTWEEAVDYFLNKKGIQGSFSKVSLGDYLIY